MMQKFKLAKIKIRSFEDNMNNTINNKINFCAGYGDPNRTIKKKYSDYASINAEIDRYRLLNTELENKASSLKQEVISAVESYQHVKGQDKAKVEKKVEALRQEIAEIEKQIAENKAHSTALWYGYHERL